MRNHSYLLSIVLTSMLGIASQQLAIAQDSGPQVNANSIETDGTFSTDVQSVDNINFVIEAGDASGENLFHSFETFSILTGGSAYFNQSVDIQNIISRVTGDSLSSIDGEIRANGSANVFLINPQGILFGPEATLNIGGTFIGTTAQRIRFADGTVLESDRTSPTPQLTLSQPVGQPTGLQLTPTSGDISVQGSSLGNAASSANSSGLALIGNGIVFQGANISQTGGLLDIGSLSSGEVTFSSLEGAPFDYSGVDSFSDIQLDAANIEMVGNADSAQGQLRGEQIEFTNAASLFTVSDLAISNQGTSQSGSGNLRVAGAQIFVLEGSLLGTRIDGAGVGNALIVESNQVQVSGSDPTNPFAGSRIVSIVGDTATDATGGDILIETNELSVFEGAAVTAELLGQGVGGSVEVLAQNVQLQGPEAARGEFIPAELSTVALPSASGRAGNVTVVTETLRLNENGALTSGTEGQADAGNVTITAEDVTVSSLSFISTAPDPGTTGNAGDITIETGALSISGSEVISNASGEGRAGDVTITANEINVGGATSFLGFFDVQAAILSGVNPGAVGDGGNLSITSDRLILDDGGVIANDVQGSAGNAGTISIRTRETTLSNQSIISSASVGLNDAAVVGQAGNILIDTTDLNIINNSVITSNTFGSGDAGNIEIRAEDIFIQGSEQFPDGQSGAGITAAVQANAAGQGGDVLIEADSLILSNVGSISSQSTGQGSAGNINITAGSILLTNRSTISSELAEGAIGEAGNLKIAADELSVSNGSVIVSSTNAVGDGGRIDIDARDINIQQSVVIGDVRSLASITTEVEPLGLGDGGDIAIVADRLSVGEGGSILARTTGDGNAGDIDISARQVALGEPSGAPNPTTFSGASNPDVSTDIVRSINSASISDGDAGSIRVVADEFSAIGEGGATVSSSNAGRSGNLSLIGRDIRLLEGGELSAESARGDRGNITIQPSELLFLDNARITTNATQTATGGNIDIEGGFILLNGDSQIVAQAVEGDGGSIQLRPIELFRSEDSLISASSALGVDGTVEIERILEEDTGFIELDGDVLNPDQLVADSCLVASDRGSGQFLISGAGGLPTAPTDPALSSFSTYDIPTAGSATGTGRDRAQTASPVPSPISSSAPAPLVEASGVHQLPDGRILLARSCS